MCVQVHEGRADSPGMDPSCQPVAAELWQLAMQPRVLSLARRLLGDDCVLHNQARHRCHRRRWSIGSSSKPRPPLPTHCCPHPHPFLHPRPHAHHLHPYLVLPTWQGVALVTPARHPAELEHAQPHQDQPINTPTVWSGRVPPPSHPLSMQALWLLDDFDYFNGATYVLPRTQQRPEHIGEWKRNASGQAFAICTQQHTCSLLGTCNIHASHMPYTYHMHAACMPYACTARTPRLRPLPPASSPSASSPGVRETWRSPSALSGIPPPPHTGPRRRGSRCSSSMRPASSSRCTGTRLRWWAASCRSGTIDYSRRSGSPAMCPRPRTQGAGATPCLPRLPPLEPLAPPLPA